ncbi:MAG: substrate-binding domain-containing protein, partial [Leifsonia sp.]
IGGPVPGIRNIGVDDRAVAHLATEHLIGLGHRDIVHLGGADDEGLNKRMPVDRRQGFLATMDAAGIPVRDEWLLTGRFSPTVSRDAMLELFAAPGPRPTAVFASSDEMAFGVMQAAQQSGMRVPDDLSVIGIDNHDWSAAFDLTTIAQDPYEHGRLGAELLLDEVRSGEPSRRSSVRADFELLVRGSTAAPPR